MHGPTAEENLVTLCGTCHQGLHPDFEPSLRELARIPGRARIRDLDGTEFRADVSRYREWAASAEAGAVAGGADHLGRFTRGSQPQAPAPGVAVNPIVLPRA